MLTFQPMLVTLVVVLVLQKFVPLLAVRRVGTNSTKRVSYTISSTLRSGVTRGRSVTNWEPTLLLSITP